MNTFVSDPAVGLVVSVELVKINMRLPTDTNDDDVLLEHLIDVATERAEHELGRSLLTKQYTTIACPTEKLRLKPTLDEIISITVTDDNDAETTLTVDDYKVIKNSAIPVLKLASTAGKQVSIVYTAGYGTAAAVPKTIKQWMMVDIATLYENREAVVSGSVASIPYPFVDGLLDRYRVEY